MKIAVGEFVKRQTKESSFSHFDGTWEELRQRVVMAFDAGHTKPGYRAGVVLVDLALGVPEHPGCIYSNIVQLKAGDKLAGEFVARTEGEDPRRAVYVIGGKKMPAESAIAVLYHHDVLAETNEVTVPDAEYEIISLNGSPFPADVEVPMSVGTLIANYFQLSGGTDTKMTPEEFVASLKKSVVFWKDKGMAAPTTAFKAFSWQEWEKAYPCRKAKSLPPGICRAHALSISTYREAESMKDAIETADQHGGLIVVEWEGLYYVVYDESYGHGFHDYEAPAV